MTKRCLFVLLLVLAVAPLAYSKGSPELIVISGGGLAQPIEITDPAQLKAFDPWTGQFADWQESRWPTRRAFGVPSKFCFI